MMFTVNCTLSVDCFQLGGLRVFVTNLPRGSAGGERKAENMVFKNTSCIVFRDGHAKFFQQRDNVLEPKKRKMLSPWCQNGVLSQQKATRQHKQQFFGLKLYDVVASAHLLKYCFKLLVKISVDYKPVFLIESKWPLPESERTGNYCILLYRVQCTVLQPQINNILLQIGKVEGSNASSLRIEPTLHHRTGSMTI